MNILDLFRRSAPVVEATTTDAPEAKALTLASSLTFGTAGHFPLRITEAELASTVAGACISLIRDTIAAIPIRVHRRLPDGSTVPDHGHPLASRFRRPCIHLDGFAWMASLVESLLVTGESHHVVHRDQRGRALELTPISSPMLYIGADGMPWWQISNAKGDPVVGPRLRHLGAPDLVPDADILIIRAAPSSYGGIRGRGPAADARGAVAVAMAAERASSQLFRSGARPGGVLKIPGKLSAEAAARLKASWDAAYGGGDNTGKTAVLEEGIAWEALTLKAVDAQFLEQRRFQVEEICRFFRVPLSKLGVSGASPRANTEAEQQAFLNDCILPWLERIESAMDAKLLADDAYCIEFDTSQFLRGDSAARATYYLQMRTAAAMTPNDVRRAEGLAPLAHPMADDPLAPLASNATTPPGRPSSSDGPAS